MVWSFVFEFLFIYLFKISSFFGLNLRFLHMFLTFLQCRLVPVLGRKAIMTINLGIWFTGDVAFRVVDAIQKAEQRVRGSALADADEEDLTRVYVCDINPSMLEIGKQRAKKRGDLYLFARPGIHLKICRGSYS
jgi:hypothetical protein